MIEGPRSTAFQDAIYMCAHLAINFMLVKEIANGGRKRRSGRRTKRMWKREPP